MVGQGGGQNHGQIAEARLAALRATTSSLRRDVGSPKPSRIKRPLAPSTPVRRQALPQAPVAYSEAAYASAHRGVMARLSCTAEGWLYDMVGPFITIGRELPHEEGDPDFCHLSDREDVRPEHFAVICENPYGVVKRFTVEVLDADAIEVNGERCTKADGAMPLSGRDIITAAGLEIIFVLAPAGEAAPASPAVAERDADEHEAGMEEWSAQRITDPILSPVGDAAASDAAAWYGALCGEDGSVFRLRKTKTAAGAADLLGPKDKLDCRVRGSAGRGLISCDQPEMASRGLSVLPTKVTVRCTTRDHPLQLNGREHSAFDGPAMLYSQDVLAFGGGGDEVTFCLPGELPHTLHNRAAARIQAAWRCFMVMTDGQLLLAKAARHEAAVRIQRRWRGQDLSRADGGSDAGWEAEEAATKFQAAWRGLQGRRTAEDKLEELLAEYSDEDDEELDVELEDEDDEEDFEDEEGLEDDEELDEGGLEGELDDDDSDMAELEALEAEEAATKVQAAFRGLQGRRKAEDKLEELLAEYSGEDDEDHEDEAGLNGEELDAEEGEGEDGDEDEDDLDAATLAELEALEAEEAEEAATKMQAAFRGLQGRRKAEDKLEELLAEYSGEDDEDHEDGLEEAEVVADLAAGTTSLGGTSSMASDGSLDLEALIARGGALAGTTSIESDVSDDLDLSALIEATAGSPPPSPALRRASSRQPLTSGRSPVAAGGGKLSREEKLRRATAQMHNERA